MTDDRAGYWARVVDRAKELGSDGCSGVPDFYLLGCLEHDVHYRTHKRIDGTSITRSEADAALRSYIQEHSPFGVFSPMAWWRWAAVRLLGRRAWGEDDGGTPEQAWPRGEDQSG